MFFSHFNKHHYGAAANEGNTSSKNQTEAIKVAVGTIGHLPILPLSLAGMVIAPPILSGPIAISSLLWCMLEKRANKRANKRLSVSMIEQVIDSVLNMLSKEFGLTKQQLCAVKDKLLRDNVISADFFAGMENAFAKGGKDYMSYFTYNRLRQYFA